MRFYRPVTAVVDIEVDEAIVVVRDRKADVSSIAGVDDLAVVDSDRASVEVSVVSADVRELFISALGNAVDAEVPD